MVAMEVEPLRSSFGDAFVPRPCVFVFDEMHVKQPKAIGTSHHSAGVATLVDVFEHHGNVAAAPGDDVLNFGQSGLSQQGPQHVHARFSVTDVSIGGKGKGHDAKLGTKKSPHRSEGISQSCC